MLIGEGRRTHQISINGSLLSGSNVVWKNGNYENWTTKNGYKNR